MWAAIKYFNPRNISGCDHVAILKNLLLYRIQRISWKTFEREYGNPFFGLNPYDKITTIYIRKVIRKCTDRVDNIVGVPAFFNPSPPYLLLPLLLAETGQDEVFPITRGRLTSMPSVARSLSCSSSVISGSLSLRFICL